MLHIGPHRRQYPRGQCSGGAARPYRHKKGAMEFVDDHEAATYTMLKQVLQNHCAMHRLSLPLAAVCVRLCASGAQVQALLVSTMTGLKQHTRAREASPPLTLLADEDELDTFIQSVQAHTLGQALGRLLYDAAEAERVTWEAAWRILLALTADLLSMLTHQYENTREERDAAIEQIGEVLTKQITHYRTQQK